MERILNANKAKRKSYSLGERVSSDGFMMNFLKITLRFAKPFIDNQELIDSKIKKIDFILINSFKSIDFINKSIKFLSR